MKRVDESYDSFRTNQSTNSLLSDTSSASSGLKRSRADLRSMSSARHTLRPNHKSTVLLSNGAKRRSSGQIDNSARSLSLSAIQKFEKLGLKNAEFNLAPSPNMNRGLVPPPISMEHNPFLASLLMESRNGSVKTMPGQFTPSLGQNMLSGMPQGTGGKSSFPLVSLLSMPHSNLVTLSEEPNDKNLKQESATILPQKDKTVSTSADSLPDLSNVNISNDLAIKKPMEYVKKLVDEYGDKSYILDSSVDDFFLKPCQEHLDAYQANTIFAIRQGDIDALREIKESGQSLQGCNKFGESIVHLSCRRSNVAVPTYLLSEGGVSLRVRDDYGRTPLHDAFWHKEPDIPLVELILNKEPQLLFISDKRGHTPLDYARKEHWETWNRYFETRIKMKNRCETTCA